MDCKWKIGDEKVLYNNRKLNVHIFALREAVTNYVKFHTDISKFKLYVRHLNENDKLAKQIKNLSNTDILLSTLNTFYELVMKSYQNTHNLLFQMDIYIKGLNNQFIKR